MCALRPILELECAVVSTIQYMHTEPRSCVVMNEIEIDWTSLDRGIHINLQLLSGLESEQLTNYNF